MTIDWSQFKRGDQLLVNMRVTVDIVNPEGKHVWVLNGNGQQFSITDEAIAAEVVRPEIIPGQPYVDADGLVYIGLTLSRVTRVDEAGDVEWFGGDGSFREGNPLPAGLRPAKVVPQ